MTTEEYQSLEVGDQIIRTSEKSYDMEKGTVATIIAEDGVSYGEKRFIISYKSSDLRLASKRSLTVVFRHSYDIHQRRLPECEQFIQDLY